MLISIDIFFYKRHNYLNNKIILKLLIKIDNRFMTSVSKPNNKRVSIKKIQIKNYSNRFYFFITEEQILCFDKTLLFYNTCMVSI